MKVHFPRLKKILGDSAYRSVGADLNVGVTIEANERKEGQKGFVPEAFRWAVERTFAWLNRQRRLVRNYEKKVQHQESMNYMATLDYALSDTKDGLAADYDFLDSLLPW